MHNIYANAWFVIAMHDTTHGYMAFKDVHLTIGGESAVVHVRRIPELADIVDSEAAAPVVGEVHEVADNVYWSSVTQRGWCYQERALSHRMIHFTSQEVLYEEGGMLSECQCKHHFGMGLGFAGYLPRAKARQENTYRDWAALVRQYTQRMFGRRSDLLLGFAGIAMAFSERQDQGRYIAGLWERDLLKWLCWRSREWVSSRASTWACNNCRPHPRRIPWTPAHPIPSFSWASRFGPCEFVYESWKFKGSVEVASIERIECLMDEENPFLRVRGLDPANWPEDPCGRYLRIRGSLYACLHFSTYGRGKEFNISMNLCLKEYAWAVPEYLVRSWDFSRDAQEILADAREYGKEYCIDAGDDLPGDHSRIYLLPLFECPEGGATICLILRPCSQKLSVEVLDGVEGYVKPHWMERIGISVFDGHRFDAMEEMPNQVIHLM
ncbi:uncharacterized protein A1O9_11520 [Exophiala aquamarina CBS 119918]|uniref:Heterokaryon incompatibility domain-containing protein n=1 Tax=Exophiala aquamarina CBS 119918 TaxID=1182545 RepID=A0A072P9T3_9EURO|nr:uncharacterized protein A1O9_11520 [Exophiala aquamarina CBS 119918]KEF52280.1 hypothetical protein A1O9_11520 [Exophiala aquamarina CBS 119918]